MNKKHPRAQSDCVHHLKIEDEADGVGQKNLGQPLSEFLWEQAWPIPQNALGTYFVQGIKNGNLNPTLFGGYVVQDAVYLKNARDSIAIAAGKATDPNIKSYLKTHIAKYTGYYEALFKSWHIENADGIDLGPASKLYSEYEKNVASNMDPIYYIVSMIPCLKLWPWLGGQISGGNFGVYKTWYGNNFDPTYTGYKILEAFINKAEVEERINRYEALQVYKRCMEGEYEFFNSAAPEEGN